MTQRLLQHFGDSKYHTVVRAWGSVSLKCNCPELLQKSVAHLDKYGTPWATKAIYEDYIKRQELQRERLYLEEVRDAYQQVVVHIHQLPVSPNFNALFTSDGKCSTMKYLGKNHDNHKYQVMVENTLRTLVVTDGLRAVIGYNNRSNYIHIPYQKNDKVIY